MIIIEMRVIITVIEDIVMIEQTIKTEKEDTAMKGKNMI